MRKPAELRELLTTAVPDFRDNPQRLHVFVEEGAISCTGTRSLSHSFSYTLTVLVQDYSGDEQAVILPILAWARRAQPDLFENADKQDRVIELEVEVLTHDTMDIEIKIPLTERVIVEADPDTRKLKARYVGEPEHSGLPSQAGHWDIYIKGELVGGFDYPAWEPKL